MSTPILRLYHRLPPPARSAAATLRGFYLRFWRYGAGSDELAQEAVEREQWSAAQWRAWQAERLGRILHRAATQVPYYRNQWQARRRSGDRASWELLENWPLLEKDAVRDTPQAFLADDVNPRFLCHEQTSGTTGKPMDIWRSRTTLAMLYSIAGARTRGWDGIPADARWARLGGQLVTPIQQRRPPFWVWNAAMRQLYLSSYHLASDLIPHYLDALRRYRIVYLAGYPSSLEALAQEALRRGRTDLGMSGVYTNAEPVYPEQRKLIAAAFQCPVRESYGMAETVAAGSECPAGRLHQWPEIGLIDIQADGEFVCTGLLNPDMPLIRYRVGDHGQPTDSAAPCECGRRLPLMGRINGRVTDVLITADGRRVFWLNPVFYGLPVRQSQIAQESLDRLRVLVAPAPGFTTAMERTIVERLHERFGPANVVVEIVDEVPRSANGKIRAVVCKLTPEERAAALAPMR